MKVLFVVWELDPFIKVGGLGDVAEALPQALQSLGVDIRIAIPFYKALKLKRCRKKLIKRFNLKYAEKVEKVEVYEVEHPLSKVPVYLLRNHKYLDTPVFPDTFAFFNKAIVSMLVANYLKWMPEIIHCNDLHTSLIPLLLKENKLPIKTMLTIHNLTYQGRTSLDILDKIGIAKSKCQIVHWEIESRKINFLLEGIAHADIITTVSPTYAKEILTEEYGAGLEEVLRAKEGRIFGVLNGIEDHKREARLLAKDAWEEEKKKNKLSLQKKLGLKVDASIPLFAFIGRFDPKQKGIDILHKMLRTIDLAGYEFIILGKGDSEWEERFQWLDTFFPKNVACAFVFNDRFAHRIYAASDFILIPSKFEPCGLIQMIAMSYGTLPIAHRTGGLIDSVKNGHNGFLFNNYSGETLRDAVEKAMHMWWHERGKYKEMVGNALSADWSWDRSAKEYLRLYEEVLKPI